MIHPSNEEEREWYVSDLINQDLKVWKSDLIDAKFHKDDANAIMRKPLSHRQALDAMIWLHTKKSVYSVKLGYHAARQLKKNEDGAETSTSPFGVQVWSKLWKLKVPNKIKVFGWKACQNTLPTCANLVRRKIIDDDGCIVCTRGSKTGVHALWDCAVAKDVSAGGLVRLQKSHQGQQDVLQLFHQMLACLSQA